MIAITAALATVFPNVGPIEVEEKSLVPVSFLALPNFASSARWIASTFSGASVLVEI